MRALILTCNTGEGHNSVAAAISEELASRGVECDVTDTLAFFSEKLSLFVSNWHTRMYRYFPDVFGKGYDHAESASFSSSLSAADSRVYEAAAERLREHIAGGGYSLVICVHVFASMLLTQVKRAGELDALTCFIDTDYTCSPFTGDSELDLYFIPNAALAGEYIANGVPEEKITVSGIPVRRAFLSGLEPREAKERLGYPEDRRNVLMMCGSMGCGHMERLTRGLLRELPSDCDLTVICGTNRRLFRSLSEDTPENLRVLAFSDSVPLLMDSAELFLTKPGGISITEAASKHLPIVLVEAVQGCEGRNMDFFAAKGWACAPRDRKGVIADCVSLLSDPAALGAQRRKLSEEFSFDSARTVCDRLFASANAKAGSR